MLSNLSPAVAAVIASTVTISLIAFLGARRRSPILFAAFVVVAWAAIGSTLGYYSSLTELVPNRISVWRHIFTALILLAPLAVVPAAFTLPAVFGKVAMRHIPVLACVGATVALPVVFLALLPTACYVAHDCP